MNVLSLVEQFRSGFSLGNESSSVALKHLVGLVSGNPRSNHSKWWKCGEGAVRFKDASLSEGDSGRMLQYLCLDETLARLDGGYREMCDRVPDCGAWLLSGVHLRLKHALGATRDPKAVMTFLGSAEGRRLVEEGLLSAEESLQERQHNGAVEAGCKMLGWINQEEKGDPIEIIYTAGREERSFSFVSVSGEDILVELVDLGGLLLTPDGNNSRMNCLFKATASAAEMAQIFKVEPYGSRRSSLASAKMYP